MHPAPSATAPVVNPRAELVDRPQRRLRRLGEPLTPSLRPRPGSACRSCTTGRPRPSCWTTANKTPAVSRADLPAATPGRGPGRRPPQRRPAADAPAARGHAAAPPRPGRPAARATRWPRRELFDRGPPRRHLALPVGPARRLPAPAGRARAGRPSCWPAGPGDYRPATCAAFIPLEFADAAYRYGHSQVRDRYQAQRAGAEPAAAAARPARLPARSRRSWRSTGRTCSTCPGRPPAQPGQADRRPPGAPASSSCRQAVTGVEGGDGYDSLAVRDLQRGQGVGLPSGEALPADSAPSRSPPRRSASARPAGGWRRRSGSTCSRSAEHRGGGRAPRARWAAAWSPRSWSASSTPTASRTATVGP